MRCSRPVDTYWVGKERREWRARGFGRVGFQLTVEIGMTGCVYDCQGARHWPSELAPVGGRPADKAAGIEVAVVLGAVESVGTLWAIQYPRLRRFSEGEVGTSGRQAGGSPGKLAFAVADASGAEADC
jgi:hypothetical protein